MLNLIWRQTARQDVRELFAYVAERNPEAALELKVRIESCAERLASHFYMYRPGRIAGTREAVVHPNYVMVYLVGADTVEVVNVLHSRQQYPPEHGE